MSTTTSLPFTGGAITVGSVAVGQSMQVLIGLALVAAGAAIIRLRFRRDREADDV